MKNKRKSVMKFIKENQDLIALVLLISVIVLAVRHWLQWDVKEIDAEFVDSEEVNAFTYEGRIYYELEQEMRKNWDDDYERIPKEFLGRIKATGVVLYAMEGDSDKAFLMGETPLNEVYVYTCKGDALPSDGKVTLVYAFLGIPGRHEGGNVHLSIVKRGFEDNLNLFQRIWEIKCNGTPIDFESPYSTTHEAVISFDMHFEGCPFPGANLYAAYQDGQWYLIDWGSEYREGEVYNYYNGYLIDDREVLEYFNAYAETYITNN